MAWRSITTDQLLNEFNQVESDRLSNIQGVGSALPQILADTVAEYVGAMNAAAYAVNNDGTVPDQLRRHVMARARWGWLVAFPQLKAFQTKERKDAADAAEKILEKIAARTFGAIEDPAGTTTSAANWNSENRLILRTHPAPPPSQQSPPAPTLPGYANPNAPPDN